MSNPRTGGIGVWIAAIFACPLAFCAFTMAFRAEWLPPDSSGWTELPFGMLLLIQLGLSLALAVAPPRAARDGWYWPLMGLVLLAGWLTLLSGMAAGMASYYE